MNITDSDVEHVAHALGSTPTGAYTTPIVYPWAVQNFVQRPSAERERPAGGRQRIYLHIPFCNYHCTFCFYAVRTGAKRDEMTRYVKALTREVQFVPEGSSLGRLIVGGGTPTALPPDLLSEALGAVFAHVPSAPDGGHTIEASPDSVTTDHLRVLHEQGIGRVSMGIESLDNDVLNAVQRRHTPAQALDACRLIAESGLTLNIDLIYGLPGQSEASFRRDLESIAQTGVASLCLYALRLNERTAVAGQLADTERFDIARLMRWRAFVRSAAADAGFTQTRSYTFKRTGAQASWHERPATPRLSTGAFEIGLGMSARSQIGKAVYRNHEVSETYMQRIEDGLSPVEAVFDLQEDDLRTQALASTLGNGRPLTRHFWESAYGVALDKEYGHLIEHFRDAGLIDDDGDRIVLTDLGLLVYDRVLLSFYSSRAQGWLAGRPANPRRGRAVLTSATLPPT
ncbi:MAG: coproporphyrinogen-III oxidase family protein [Vicinamibacterales bacterium]